MMMDEQASYFLPRSTCHLNGGGALAGHHHHLSNELPAVSSSASSFEFYANHLPLSCSPLEILESQEQQLQQQQNPEQVAMKNVHFSPVVSQLRYPSQQNHHRHRTDDDAHYYASTGIEGDITPFNFSSSDGNEFSPGGGAGIQKVTVQVQQVERPKLQRIQVSVPPSPTRVEYPPEEEGNPEQEGGLFAKQLKILKDRSHHHHQWLAEEEKNCRMPAPTESVVLTSTPPVKSTVENGKGKNFENVLMCQQNRNVNTIGSLELLPPLLVSEEKDTNVKNQRKGNNKNSHSWSHSQGTPNKLATSNGSDETFTNINGSGKKRNSSSGKSFLQWISFGKLGGGGGSNGSSSSERGGGSAVKNKSVNNKNGSSGGGSKSKSQKRSSCPPLGHPLLLNGGVVQQQQDNSSSDLNNSFNWSSGGGASCTTSSADNSAIDNDDGLESDGVIKNQVICLTVGKKDSPPSSPIASKSASLPPKPFSQLRHPSKRSPLLLPRLHHSTGGISDNEDDEFSVNFERIIEGIFDSSTSSSAGNQSNQSTVYHTSISSPPQLPPKKKHPSKMTTTQKPQFGSDCADEPAAGDDELGSIESMEQKLISLSSGDGAAASEDIKEQVIESDRNIPVAGKSMILKQASSAGDGVFSSIKPKSATIPVLGKPPKPPSSMSASSSASKYYGMRSSTTGAPLDRFPPAVVVSGGEPQQQNKVFRRNQHLLYNSRDYSSSSSSTLPQAMLELAQKLVSFKEELHRSREHIASSHSATLEEIHLLRTIHLPNNYSNSSSNATTTTGAVGSAITTTTGIDPLAPGGRRNLPPPSRNTSTTISTTTTCTTPAIQQQNGSSRFSINAARAGDGGSSSCSISSHHQNHDYHQPVSSGSSLTSSSSVSFSLAQQALLKEWDNRVLRAKEKFTQRGRAPATTATFYRGGGDSSRSSSTWQEQVNLINNNIKNGNTSSTATASASKSSSSPRDPSAAAAASGGKAQDGTAARATSTSGVPPPLLETDLDGILFTSSTTGAIRRQAAAAAEQGYGEFCDDDDNGGQEHHHYYGDEDGVDGGRGKSCRRYSSTFKHDDDNYYSSAGAGNDNLSTNGEKYWSKTSAAVNNSQAGSSREQQQKKNTNKRSSSSNNNNKGGYYSSSLQNLSSFGEGAGESVISVNSAYSQEDLAANQNQAMATLKPCEPAGGGGAAGDGKEDRSRSMEFLLDSEKNAHLRPPENTLQKSQQQGSTTVGGERRMSEHELRIQRSLQKLNVPDWYKRYATSTPSSAANTPSKSRGGEFGSGTGLAGGWPGLSSSKTNSLTSLQSAGRYAGSKSGFGVYGSGRQSRAGTGGSTTGGRNSRESLMMMSPSSTASASPSPNFERSSFTYGMPYALTRFAAARMSCGASPASLSPSPSPVGGIGVSSSTSTPVSSGPAARGYGHHHGYQKTPYLGWRSQERLSSKSLYRSPAERLAADIMAQQKAKQSPLQTPQTPQPPSVLASPASSTAHGQVSSTATTPTSSVQGETHQQQQQHHQYHHYQQQQHQHPLPPPEIEVNRISPTKSNVTSATASDLSLNNSEESNSHKLNRVRSSIKEVSNAIVDYVNETKPLDDGMNGRASPRRGFVWLESSFVGTKPIDSPSTPDTPSTFIGRGATGLAAATSKDSSAAAVASHFRFDTHELPTSAAGGGGIRSSRGGGDESTSSTSHYTSYIARNEQMEERSNSSSVSSPTLEDILDSLLALRRPNKKFRSKQGGKGHESATSPTPPPITTTTTSTTVPTTATTKPSSSSVSSTGGVYGGDMSEDISSSYHYHHSSTSSNTPPQSTTGATYGSSSCYTDDITSTGSAAATKPYSKSGGGVSSSPSKVAGAAGGTSTTSYQYQYQSTTSTASSAYDHQPPSSTTTTSEIYSSNTSGGGGGAAADIILRSKTPTMPATSSSPSYQQHRSYQSDWQDRMNQPLPDSTFTYGSSATSGDTFTSISSRYSTGSSTTTGGGGGAVGGDALSSPGALSSSAVSSLHSTPTHQQYNRQSSSTSGTTTTTSGGAVKDSSSSPYYYSSSCHSSPAKSILGGGSGSAAGIDRGGGTNPISADSSELLYHQRRSTASSSRDPEEEDELAFGNPTEILRSSSITTAPPSTNNNMSGGGGIGGATSTTGASTQVAPLQGGVIINPLTGLSEYSNPPTPARHRRVSFDLDFSDKEEKSSSRSRNKEENVGGTIQCRNTKCAKTATGLEARREFKVCHNCNAYYCSRECRRAHWEKHKKTCMQSRVGAICKQIISHVKEDSYVMNQLSTTAKRGFLAKGRGVVKLFFNSPDRAERFLTGGLPELPEPLYIPHSDMLPEEMGVQIFSELTDQCRSYNPETRFVLYACVCVVNEVPTHGAVKWERELISRSSKLRLLLPRHFFEENQRHHHLPANPAHHMNIPSAPSPHLQQPSPNQESISPGGDSTTTTTTTSNGGGGALGSSPSHYPHVPLYDSVPMSAASVDLAGSPLPPPPPHLNTTTSESDNTLILRSVPPPSSHQLSAAEHKRLREVSFTNIQRHLLLRGVDIKRSYPDIFSKLCRYVEHDEPFLPVTIYPKNQQTGRQFVCVIMPECSDSSCGHAHTSLANQEATIAAAVASAAAFTSSFAATAGLIGDIGGGGGYRQDGGQVPRPCLQRVETINISEPGDDFGGGGDDDNDKENVDLT